MIEETPDAVNPPFYKLSSSIIAILLLVLSVIIFTLDGFSPLFSASLLGLSLCALLLSYFHQSVIWMQSIGVKDLYSSFASYPVIQAFSYICAYINAWLSFWSSIIGLKSITAFSLGLTLYFMVAARVLGLFHRLGED